jgi:hypothetical protein
VVALDHIKIDNVGRLDSLIHNLDEFEIPQKVKRGTWWGVHDVMMMVMCMMMILVPWVAGADAAYRRWCQCHRFRRKTML